MSDNITSKSNNKKAHRRSVWPRRLATGFLVLCWMLIIGSFSAQSGAESGSLSRSVAKKVVTVEEKLTRQTYTNEERDTRIEHMQLPIRKLAHMAEYAILAMLLTLHLGCYALAKGVKAATNSFYLRLFLAWLISAVYAATDEIHQLFVDSRNGSFTDVCIDSAGAFLGLFCLWIFCKIFKRHREKDKKYQ